MIKWIKKFFTIEPYEYKGSSVVFKKLYDEILFDIENNRNNGIIISKIDVLTCDMVTSGDGDMVKKLQAKLRLKINMEGYIT